MGGDPVGEAPERILGREHVADQAPHVTDPVGQIGRPPGGAVTPSVPPVVGAQQAAQAPDDAGHEAAGTHQVEAVGDETGERGLAGRGGEPVPDQPHPPPPRGVDVVGHGRARALAGRGPDPRRDLARRRQVRVGARLQSSGARARTSAASGTASPTSGSSKTRPSSDVIRTGPGAIAVTSAASRATDTTRVRPSARVETRTRIGGVDVGDRDGPRRGVDLQRAELQPPGPPAHEQRRRRGAGGRRGGIGRGLGRRRALGRGQAAERRGHLEAHDLGREALAGAHPPRREAALGILGHRPERPGQRALNGPVIAGQLRPGDLLLERDRGRGVPVHAPNRGPGTGPQRGLDRPQPIAQRGGDLGPEGDPRRAGGAHEPAEPQVALAADVEVRGHVEAERAQRPPTR